MGLDKFPVDPTTGVPRLTLAPATLEQWRQSANEDVLHVLKHSESWYNAFMFQVRHGFDLVVDRPDIKGFVRNLPGANNDKEVLVRGQLHNTTLEQFAFGAYAASTQEARQVAAHLYEDHFLDAGVLLAADGPTEDDRLHFVGVKWLALRSPAPTLMNNRDFVYLAYDGAAIDAQGNRVMFQLLQTMPMETEDAKVEYNGAAAGLTHGKLSTLHIYRQNGVSVDVFSRGVCATGGMLPSLVTSKTVAYLFCGVANTESLADMRALTRGGEEALSHAQQSVGAKISSSSCVVCRRGLRLSRSKRQCHCCRHAVCKKCTKDMWIMDDGRDPNENANNARVSRTSKAKHNATPAMPAPVGKVRYCLSCLRQARNDVVAAIRDEIAPSRTSALHVRLSSSSARNLNMPTPRSLALNRNSSSPGNLEASSSGNQHDVRSSDRQDVNEAMKEALSASKRGFSLRNLTKTTSSESLASTNTTNSSFAATMPIGSSGSFRRVPSAPSIRASDMGSTSSALDFHEQDNVAAAMADALSASRVGNGSNASLSRSNSQNLIQRESAPRVRNPALQRLTISDFDDSDEEDVIEFDDEDELDELVEEEEEDDVDTLGKLPVPHRRDDEDVDITDLTDVSRATAILAQAYKDDYPELEYSESVDFGDVADVAASLNLHSNRREERESTYSFDDCDDDDRQSADLDDMLPAAARAALAMEENPIEEGEEEEEEEPERPRVRSRAKSPSIPKQLAVQDNTQVVEQEHGPERLVQDNLKHVVDADILPLEQPEDDNVSDRHSAASVPLTKPANRDSRARSSLPLLDLASEVDEPETEAELPDTPVLELTEDPVASTLEEGELDVDFGVDVDADADEDDELEIDTAVFEHVAPLEYRDTIDDIPVRAHSRRLSEAPGPRRVSSNIVEDLLTVEEEESSPPPKLPLVVNLSEEDTASIHEAVVAACRASETPRSPSEVRLSGRRSSSSSRHSAASSRSSSHSRSASNSNPPNPAAPDTPHSSSSSNSASPSPRTKHQFASSAGPAVPSSRTLSSRGMSTSKQNLSASAGPSTSSARKPRTLSTRGMSTASAASMLETNPNPMSQTMPLPRHTPTEEKAPMSESEANESNAPPASPTPHRRIGLRTAATILSYAQTRTYRRRQAIVKSPLERALSKPPMDHNARAPPSQGQQQQHKHGFQVKKNLYDDAEIPTKDVAPKKVEDPAEAAPANDNAHPYKPQLVPKQEHPQQQHHHQQAKHEPQHQQQRQKQPEQQPEAEAEEPTEVTF